jgi:glycosyltransferase involved in cell wall biosynthesis
VAGNGGHVRIAMVHGPGSPRHDGVSDYVHRLASALRHAGAEVTSVPVGPPGRGGWFAAAGAAADRVRLMCPDVVHVQFAPSAFRFSGLPGLLPRLLPPRLRLVTTVHEYGWWASPAWLPAMMWHPLEAARIWDRETGRLILDSAAVIVTNRGHADLVHRRTGIRPAHIPLAPNVEPVPAPTGVRGRVRRRLGLPAGTFLLASFGFVHPVKGIRYVLEALPAVLAARPDLHLLVIGGFTSQALPEPEAQAFREELQARAERSGVSGAVTFTGHLEAAEVSELLLAADAGVLAFTAGVTLKSGSLLALLAHGVPTAVTVADQPDEALRDGDTVAVIGQRRDAPAVARTLVGLVTDTDLRRRVAAGGRALAAPHAWPAVARTHLRVYESVTDGGRG